MRPWPPVAAAGAAALSLCLLAVACSGGGTKKLIPPPPVTVARLTTAPPGSDFSSVALPVVEGKVPVKKIEISGGDATLAGVINGPEGPVAGAVVRVERLVGDAVTRLDVVSNADGSWRAPQPAASPFATVPTSEVTVPGQLPTIPAITTTFPPTSATKPTGPQGILGGRYRVRAWRSPDLALTTPQILFVEAKQNKTLGIQLSRYTGIAASAVTAPDPPVLNGVTNVTAVVTTVSVDGDGIVRAVPLPGATVSLTVGSGWLFSGGGPTSTNGQGRATFQIRCQALGPSPVELTVNSSQTFTLPVRACVAPPSTTSSIDPNGGSPTSLSIPGGSSSTTRGRPPVT